MPAISVTEGPFSSDFRLKPRGLWCPGLVSNVSQGILCSKKFSNVSGSKYAMETTDRGGEILVRSQSCPWSNMNVQDTNLLSSVDPLQYQKFLADVFTLNVRMPSRSRSGGWCKHCAMLESHLTKWLKQQGRKAQKDFLLVSAGTTKGPSSLAHEICAPLSTDCSSKKQRLEPAENNKTSVSKQVVELTRRATEAEQRVVELEKYLYDHGLSVPPERDIVPALSTLADSQFFKETDGLLVCDAPGCNRPFKSSKTLRRHIVLKHSNTARSLVCNQMTVEGVLCEFKTTHTGVLSYHRRHGLKHQRKEDWHISCSFCQSKFARQHEMERHQKICRSRPEFSEDYSSDRCLSDILHDHNLMAALAPDSPESMSSHQQDDFQVLHSAVNFSCHDIVQVEPSLE